MSFVPCALAMLQGCFSARSDARRVFQGCSMIPPATPERPPRHPACHPDSWAAIQGRFSEFCPGCDSWKKKRPNPNGRFSGAVPRGTRGAPLLPPPPSLRLPPSACLPPSPFALFQGFLAGFWGNLHRILLMLLAWIKDSWLEIFLIPSQQQKLKEFRAEAGSQFRPIPSVRK